MAVTALSNAEDMAWRLDLHQFIPSVVFALSLVMTAPFTVADAGRALAEVFTISEEGSLIDPLMLTLSREAERRVRDITIMRILFNIRTDLAVSSNLHNSDTRLDWGCPHLPEEPHGAAEACGHC